MSNILRQAVYGNRWIANALGAMAASFQYTMLNFYKGPEVVRLIKRVKKEVHFAFFPIEAYLVYSIARQQSRLAGDMAEVGVFQGGSAKLICEVKGKAALHLFDTFTGLPPIEEMDKHFGVQYWKDKEFSNTSEEAVRTYLSDYPDVVTHKGLFPQTAGPVSDKRFSFVHLDVDLYQSTLDCLEFFYPRLVRGGAIVSHDYHSTGVRQAFEEFCASRDVFLMDTQTSQCVLVKTED